MEYQKIINLLGDIKSSWYTLNQPSKFRTKNWVETMMTQVEYITKVVKLNLKLQCWNQLYAIIVMHIFL